jgi:hypothetical protein
MDNRQLLEPERAFARIQSRILTSRGMSRLLFIRPRYRTLLTGEFVGEAHMIESELSGKTLREGLEALDDFRSHIQNLHRICRGREEKLLEKIMEGSYLKGLHKITQLYRATCSSSEPEWDNFQEVRDRALFWYHIGRLRLACELWRLRRTPRLCCSMALSSLQALEVLTPGLLDAL